MPRIPILDRDTMNAEQRAIYDRIVSGPRGSVRGPLLAALHRPELAERWEAIGELLRYRTSLSPRHSELAILVTARSRDCPLEWHIHEPIAVQAGVPEDVIEALRCRDIPRFEDPGDAAIYDFTVQLHRTTHVSDAAYREIERRYGTVGTIELTALVGYYTMVAMTLNAHQLPLPAGAEPFAKAAFEPAEYIT